MASQKIALKIANFIFGFIIIIFLCVLLWLSYKFNCNTKKFNVVTGY